MATLTTSDKLARELAIRSGISLSDARRIVRDLFGAIGDELAAAGEVKLIGLGKIRIVRRSAEAWNPKTRKMIQRKRVNGVAFIPAKDLEKKIND